jgi:hypothetical protein
MAGLPRPRRDIVVTATDDAFFPLCRDLVSSLASSGARSAVDVGVLDLGVSGPHATWLRSHADKVVIPGWDLRVKPALQAGQPHLRALAARPFLRDHLPGYERYLWMDADAWVQQGAAVDLLFQATGGGALAIVPQVDRCYAHTAGNVSWRSKRLATCFGQSAVRLAQWSTYFNSGVFALPGDAPHWKAWADRMQAGIDASGGTLVCDQTALNHLLWTTSLPRAPLPATCNWTCHLAPPRVDPASGILREPHLPRRPLGIVHLTARTKDLAEFRYRGPLV